jgi:hypothetical protein
MPNRFGRCLLEGLAPTILLCGSLAAPSLASPAGSQSSGPVALARQEVRITASVRPTIVLRRQVKDNKEGRPLCIWSNAPTIKYELRLEGHGGLEHPIPLALQGAEFECPAHNSISSLLEKFDPADAHGPHIVTLIISPH